jgi:hypothetical protein
MWGDSEEEFISSTGDLLAGIIDRDDIVEFVLGWEQERDSRVDSWEPDSSKPFSMRLPMDELGLSDLEMSDSEAEAFKARLAEFETQLEPFIEHIDVVVREAARSYPSVDKALTTPEMAQWCFNELKHDPSKLSYAMWVGTGAGMVMPVCFNVSDYPEVQELVDAVVDLKAQRRSYVEAFVISFR